MKTPPFLMGAALIFWGWQVGLLPVAIAVAVTLESSRYVDARLDLEQDHFNRLWNLCWLVFIGVAMYIFFAKGGFSAVNELVQTRSLGARSESLKQVSSSAMVFIQWLPLVYVPFMVAFVFSRTEKLPWTTFSFLYQKQHEQQRRKRHRYIENIEFNPTHAYLVLVLVSASATRAHPQWFFPFISLLVLWGIWPKRNRRFSTVTWAAIFITALVIAFGGQVGLLAVRKQLGLLQTRLMNQFGQAEFDSSRTRTAMGSVGKLHQSNRIALRVATSEGNPPELLMEAAYNVSQGAFWTSRRASMQVVAQPKGILDWTLNTNAIPRSTVTVTRYAGSDGDVNLALPVGPVVVENFDALAINTNRLGAAEGLTDRRVATYDVRYADDGGFAVPPEEDDLDFQRTQLSHVARQAVDTVADRLKLHKLSDEEAVRAIGNFFARNFSYSTYLKRQESNRGGASASPLAAFLLTQQEGHCEYFASATVHLLRTAGIPARYAVGYAIQEKRDDREWVARSRHAHAWALAWMDNRWQVVDNTPYSWVEIESSSAGLDQTFSDWFSDAWLAFSLWREGDSAARIYVFAAGIVVLGFMAWRQVSGKRWSRLRNNRPQSQARDLPGLDSAFYEIEEALTKRSVPRESHEPMQSWINRLQKIDPKLTRELPSLIDLHYRLRFDPTGLAAGERNQLVSGVQEWLSQHARASG